jgi:hypothetical protein
MYVMGQAIAMDEKLSREVVILANLWLGNVCATNRTGDSRASRNRNHDQSHLVRRQALILALIQNVCGKLLHESRKFFPAISNFNASTMCFPREVR